MQNTGEDLTMVGFTNGSIRYEKSCEAVTIAGSLGSFSLTDLLSENTLHPLVVSHSASGQPHEALISFEWVKNEAAEGAPGAASGPSSCYAKRLKLRVQSLQVVVVRRFITALLDYCSNGPLQVPPAPPRCATPCHYSVPPRCAHCQPRLTPFPLHRLHIAMTQHPTPLVHAWCH